MTALTPQTILWEIERLSPVASLVKSPPRSRQIANSAAGQRQRYTKRQKNEQYIILRNG